MTRDPNRRYPILIASNEVLRGRVITVRVDDIEIESGRNVRREVVLHPGAVVIVPVTADGHILWVRQYRYAADRELLELPAGTLEQGEDPLDCAGRELEEETGFVAASIERLGGFFSAPGFCNEYLHAYVATGLTETAVHPDEDEEIEIEPLTLAESLQRLDGGEIEDAKSIAALHLYLRRQQRT